MTEHETAVLSRLAGINWHFEGLNWSEINNYFFVG
jgi:hypothetical protein